MAAGLIRKSKCAPACDGRAAAPTRAADADRDDDWPRPADEPAADTDGYVVDYWHQRGTLFDLALWG